MKVVAESLAELDHANISTRSLRWELGSSWVEHLQKLERSAEKSRKSTSEESVEQVVIGLGKQFKSLKKRDKVESNPSDTVGDSTLEPSSSYLDSDMIGSEENNVSIIENGLSKYISEDAFGRLKDTGTNLHTKV